VPKHIQRQLPLGIAQRPLLLSVEGQAGYPPPHDGAENVGKVRFRTMGSARYRAWTGGNGIRGESGALRGREVLACGLFGACDGVLGPAQEHGGIVLISQLDEAGVEPDAVAVVDAAAEGEP
jgi:hypothetical protein